MSVYTSLVSSRHRSGPPLDVWIPHSHTKLSDERDFKKSVRAIDMERSCVSMAEGLWRGRRRMSTWKKEERLGLSSGPGSTVRLFLNTPSLSAVDCLPSGPSGVHQPWREARNGGHRSRPSRPSFQGRPRWRKRRGCARTVRTVLWVSKISD